MSKMKSIEEIANVDLQKGDVVEFNKHVLGYFDYESINENSEGGENEYNNYIFKSRKGLGKNSILILDVKDKSIRPLDGSWGYPASTYEILRRAKK